MNTPKYLLAAVVATFSVALSAQADEALMSPKARAQAESLRIVPGTTPDMIDRSINAGSPKYAAFQHSLRRVPSAGPSLDLAHAPRPMLSPKDPRYETALRENAAKQFTIAPLR
jgi:hypothetical protein